MSRERDRERELEEKEQVRGIIGGFEQAFHADLAEARGDGGQQDQAEKEADMRRLEQAWLREKSVPALLPYEDELIERILERVRTQLEFIETNSVELQTHEKDIKLMLVIVESELERVQFLLRAYVRLRLRKIDTYALYIQAQEQGGDPAASVLSPDEKTYMEGHLAMIHGLFDAQFVGRLHSAQGNLGDDPAMVVAPPTDSHVFFRVVSEAPGHLGQGEVHVARFSTVAQALAHEELEIV